MSRVARRVGLIVSLSLLPLASALAAGRAVVRVVDVQVHVQRALTRVAFELDGPAAYAVVHDPSDAASRSEVRVHFEARGAYQVLDAVAALRMERAVQQGLVASVRLTPDGPGGLARIHLTRADVAVRHAVLSNPTRIVLDLSPAPRAPVRLADASPLGRPRRIEEPPAERQRRRRLTERPEEKRPDRPVAVPILGRPLVVSGDYEVRARYERDARLDRREDDRAALDQKLELELFYPVGPGLSLFAETKYAFDWDFHREDGRTGSEGVLERGETWLHAARLGGSPFGLQLGRQNLRDEREWWWDEDLDSLRLHFAGERLEAQLALGQEIAPDATDASEVAPEHDDVLRLLASARWHYAGRHELSGFLLGQHDHSRREVLGALVEADREDETDADLVWLGLRARGEWGLGSLGNLGYWGDAGGVAGRERVADFGTFLGDLRIVDEVSERDVLGWAFDTGLSWATPLPGRPSLSLAYAIGSGDRDPADRTARTFRQTGLQDNDARLGGAARVRYYGELLDPELSNLHVATVALGFPLLHASGIAFLYHYYHQVYATDWLRAEGIRAAPTGERGSLGHGFDVVLALEEWEHVRLEAIGSVFRAGAAYGEERRTLAYGGGLKLEVGF